jgi:hypothetical protein
VVPIGEKGNIQRVLLGKPEGNGQLVRPSRRWELNYFIVLCCVSWIVSTVM